MSESQKLSSIRQCVKRIEAKLEDIDNKLIRLANQQIIIQARDHIKFYNEFNKLIVECDVKPLRPIIVLPMQDVEVKDPIEVAKKIEGWYI